jgi:hypothetical protein
MNPTGRRRELARLAGQIKTLPLELQNVGDGFGLHNCCLVLGRG